MEKSNDKTDWGALRNQAAIAAMQGLVEFYGGSASKSNVVEWAVEQADKLIEKLKEGTEQKMSLDDVCLRFGLKEIGEFSDGYHTFNSLYHQRAVLFAALVKAHRDKAWKSWKHEDGEPCFNGKWFIVGIDTPKGSYTYHYEEKYWSMFDCLALERAKHWDGHTDKDVERLLSL